MKATKIFRLGVVGSAKARCGRVRYGEEGQHSAEMRSAAAVGCYFQVIQLK